jgi:hypothetical protein
LEGKVLVNGRPVTPRDIGSAAAQDGGIVSTRQGRAEILLTPGAVLRLGGNSQIRMDAELLTDTRFTLLSGSAMVEVDQIFPENHIVIAQGNATTALKKAGLYRFDAAGPAVSVLKGEAVVDRAGRNVTVKEQHQVILSDARLKSHKFDRPVQDELYAWSRLRSEYGANASAQEAGMVSPGGPGWYGANWYWDPWFDGYAFVAADGFFYGPFGFPFFSPFYAGWYGGWGWGGYGHGWYGHGGYGHGWGRGGFGHGAAMAHGFSGGHMGGGFGGGHMGGGFGGGGGGGRR